MSILQIIPTSKRDKFCASKNLIVNHRDQRWNKDYQRNLFLKKLITTKKIVWNLLSKYVGGAAMYLSNTIG